MFEDFKEKICQKQKQKQSNPPKCLTMVFEQLNKQGIPKDNLTLEQLFPEQLDSCGCDLSFMTYAEFEIMIAHAKGHEYLLKKYPQTKQEAELVGRAWIEDPHEPLQINIAKAQTDPMGDKYFEVLCKLKTIYDKMEVFQAKASEYEKVCLRLYSFLSDKWRRGQSVEQFREMFLTCKEDLFEIVETYFKICKKYQVPVFEEPYYFLNDQQKMEVKLEGDMLRRTGVYSDFEIHISILEEIV